MGEDVTMLHRGQVHADGVLARDRVQLTPGEIFPSMYVRNLQQEKGIEKIFGAVRTECTEWDWKGQVRTLVLWKRLNGQLLLLKAVFLCNMIPITGPQFQSALNASCSYLQVLGSPTCPCKLLKTLVILTLKKLHSTRRDRHTRGVWSGGGPIAVLWSLPNDSVSFSATPSR